ncbi:unnamed protein product [Ranitomeya imitator]|uniref:Acetyl-CoA carboxylase n=1 Tax=Ranitomeya imitator TaxID=111125 RepID=A0ABN9LKS7_9NEOB|nr:unnamed protein product [Ranitomeya imitator]
MTEYDDKEQIKALFKLWGPGEPRESDMLTYTELVLDNQGQLVQLNRLPGGNERYNQSLSSSDLIGCSAVIVTSAMQTNKTYALPKNQPLTLKRVGMVAFKMKIKSPEYPKGRDIIVICNDITYKIGSFGPQEDMLFLRASEFARKEGIPRIYIAANSGARIGLAEELRHMFNVAWIDPSDPYKAYTRVIKFSQFFVAKLGGVGLYSGQLILEYIRYVYLILLAVNQYVLTDIIGKEEGIGVENLRGSGTIAGESSLAYDEIITISMVTCRAIGIGAYLVRLGQRVIQVENSHIILTGAGALNKVLGREVYTSNNQLGGVQIMCNNGVSHTMVPDDFEGVYTILQWLSYMPKDKHSPVPVISPSDPIDRLIEFIPTKAPYDPRWMLAGRPHPTIKGTWQTGFFDLGSFKEIMQRWAQTVIVGRARLGGIPLGVIAVETRSVETAVPADPANPESEAKIIQQAGQVWFPDSAFKTAQAIKDFNREGLPIIIFANWRGFSGGMKDMYDQVLKFGAYIVDSLREFKQPVLVYIPPFAELRGGSWVVIDPTINPLYMELYADKDSRCAVMGSRKNGYRGGVLEAEGTVEIRFRRKDLIKTMRRLDPIYTQIVEQLGTPELSELERKSLEKKLKAREDQLLPIYHQIAVKFADLHDTPGRMQEKGVITRFLRFAISNLHFQFITLPFGLASATRVFTKVMAAVVSIMHSQGIVILPYLDGLLVKGPSFRACKESVSITLDILARLGLLVNLRKLPPVPSLRITFLGMIFDTSP